MKVKKTTSGHVEIRCSLNELAIINNALNEVCNGVDVPHFQTRIGVKREKAQKLLKSVHQALDTIGD